MLTDELRTQLKAYMAHVTVPVELVAATDGSESSDRMLALLNEVAARSDKVSVIEQPGADPRTPSFRIQRAGTEVGVRFAGIPTGHEFSSMVLALLQVGGHPPRLAAETLEAIRSLEGEFRFETYMSLSCQNCPEVVQALNLLSIVNPRIQHVAIDGALFQDEVQRRDIMAVPTVFLNGEVFGQGRMGVEEILARIDTGAEERVAAQIAAKDPFDVLVVGGALPAPRQRCTPRARGSAPGWLRSASAARCWTHWRSRTSSP